MLFTCPRAKDVWCQLGLWQRLEEILIEDRSGSVLLQEILRRGDPAPNFGGVGFAEAILTGSWYIWWERRQKAHGEALWPTHPTALAVAALATNYMLAQRTCSKIRKGWSKPPEGKLMINVDASFDSDTGSGSTGVVIRDATGECVAASCCHLPHVTDAAMAEAYALRDGQKLAQQIGSNRFIVQADCMMVVETMKEGGFSATSAAPIYDDCYNMWRDFVDASIEHCHI